MQVSFFDCITRYNTSQDQALSRSLAPHCFILVLDGLAFTTSIYVNITEPRIIYLKRSIVIYTTKLFSVFEPDVVLYAQLL